MVSAYKSITKTVFDDSVDAWFMCITSLLLVGSVPRFLLYKEHTNIVKTSYLEIVFLHVCFVYYYCVVKNNNRSSCKIQSPDFFRLFISSRAGLPTIRQSKKNENSHLQCITAYSCIGPVCTSLHYLCVPVHATFHLLSKQQANYWSVLLFPVLLIKLYYSHKDETMYYWKWHQWNTSWQLFYYDRLWCRDNSLIFTIQYRVVPENIHISPWNGFM